MIAVCGPNEPTEEERALAEDVGRAIAAAGCVLVCGGRGGVMAAACKGAKAAGGTTIGILPGYDRADANEWVDFPIPTGLGHARNALVVASGDAVIAVGGGFGTLSEIGLALKMGKPVISLGSWPLDQERISRFGAENQFFMMSTADEAVAHALTYARPDLRPRQSPTGHG
ncbi:MAG TPA: TIGR00725 family protein [Nitrolancea sp.]|nr:TIGR00725 family protein [Nitrolancea sp.]